MYEFIGVGAVWACRGFVAVYVEYMTVEPNMSSLKLHEYACDFAQ